MAIIEAHQKTFIGVPAIAVGLALWHAVGSLVEPSVWIAKVMYAEDFDLAAGVPGWFWPWRIALRNSLLIEGLILALGSALIVLGAMSIKSIRPTGKLLVAQVSAALVCVMLAVNIGPLYQASIASSMSWGQGSPAFLKLAELKLANSTSWLYVALALTSISCTTIVRKKYNNSLKSRRP